MEQRRQIARPPATRHEQPGALPAGAPAPRTKALDALLCVHSYYSLGSGTASPQALVRRAAGLGYRYLALTDHLSISGAVDLFEAARQHGIKALVGATVPVRIEEEAFPLVLIATSRRGYRNLNELITMAIERAQKDLPLPVLLANPHDLVVLSGDRRGFPTTYLARRHLRIWDHGAPPSPRSLEPHVT